jgi:hypothetical protein
MADAKLRDDDGNDSSSGLSINRGPDEGGSDAIDGLSTSAEDEDTSKECRSYGNMRMPAVYEFVTKDFYRRVSLLTNNMRYRAPLSSQSLHSSPDI